MTSSVGYKKPPKNRRFKKGQSGNPKGRPKKERGIANLLRSELNGHVTIRKNGKSKRIPVLEALLKRLLQKALDGDPIAMKQTFSLILSKMGEQSQIDQVIFQMINRPPRGERS